MKDEAIGCAAGLALLAALIGGSWAFRYYSAPIEGAVQVREATIDRQVFQSTASYVLGKEQTLSKYEGEYRQAKDPSTKSALRNEIENEASTVDRSQLSPQMQSFLSDMETR